MALLPPIPSRPADRPETWSEYLARRATISMHRQLLDELSAWTGGNFGILQRLDLEIVMPHPRFGSLGRFRGYHLSAEERRRIEGTI